MKLFYRKYGEGRPVVILHGIFGISDNWVTIGRRLAEKFEVYIPDQRNHGQSPHSSTFNYFALMDDLFELINDRQLNNPVLIGHSMGGKVAMKFCLDNPTKVEKLVVVDISTRAYPARQEHLAILNAMLSVDFDRVETREEVEEILAHKVKSERIRLFIMKNLYRIGKSRMAWRLNVEAIYNNIEKIFEGIESPYSFDKPALFVKGGASNYILDEDRELILKNFPHAQFRIVDNASHWVHADNPEQLCAHFSGFLEEECDYSV